MLAKESVPEIKLSHFFGRNLIRKRSGIARGPGIFGSVQRHGLADECLERRLVDLVTFEEVECTPSAAFETRVDEPLLQTMVHVLVTREPLGPTNGLA